MISVRIREILRSVDLRYVMIRRERQDSSRGVEGLNRCKGTFLAILYLNLFAQQEAMKLINNSGSKSKLNHINKEVEFRRQTVKSD